MSHHLLPELLVTPIVEIIYSENRIVVDYDYEGLVLLGLVWKNTGYEMSYLAAEEFARTHQFPLVRRFEKSLAECAGENENNAEGYVLTYPSTGLKVKVKFEEYVRLHRILTGLNPRAIWEMLVPPEMLQKSPQAAELNAAVAEKRLASVDSILGDPKMPTGFIAWFGGWVNYLRTEFARIEREAKAVFDNRPIIRPNNIDGVLELGERKTQALYFLQAPSLCGVLFAMLDGKGYDTIIWKSIKPRGDAESYKRDGE
jgi:RNA ligase